jgi:outer membrane protein assembly factor BamE
MQLGFRSFLVGLVFGIIVACQTAPLRQFDQVHEGMQRDDVLDLLGSPNRTEQVDGRLKYAYKYFDPEKPDVVEYRYILFENNRVVSFGLDQSEIKRLEEIRAADDHRAARRSKPKTQAEAEATLKKELKPTSKE